MLPEVIDVPTEFGVRALTSEHRVSRLLARSITPRPVGFVPRHAVRCLGQNTCAVSTFAAEVLILFDRRRFKEYPSRLSVDNGLAEKRR